MNAVDKRIWFPFAQKVAACAVRDLSLEALSILRRYPEKRRPKPPAVVAREAKEKQERLIGKMVRAEVRAACVKRAGGKCEACRCPPTGIIVSLEMDHFYGRAHSESVETCWMLCRACHARKTENYPLRAWWDEVFRRHCQKYGYPFRKRFTKTIARRQRSTGPTSLHGAGTSGAARRVSLTRSGNG